MTCVMGCGDLGIWVNLDSSVSWEAGGPEGRERWTITQFLAYFSDLPLDHPLLFKKANRIWELRI